MIEIVLKKHFWAVVLGFLVAASYLSARAATNVVPLWVRADPGAAKGAPVFSNKPQHSGKLRASSAILHGRNIFDPSGGRVTPPIKPKKTKPVVKKVKSTAPKDTTSVCRGASDPRIQKVRSALRLKLVGTIVSDVAETSLAAFQKIANRSVEFYREGDSLLANSTLCKIEAKMAIVLRDGNFEYVEMDADPAPRSYRPARRYKPRRRRYARRRRKGRGRRRSYGVKSMGRGQFTIKRSTVESWLQNPMQHAMSARIVPFFKGGRPKGFRLFRIRPGSLYSTIGLRNGDVISRINGYEMSSPQRALEVYSKLRHSRSITVDIIRNGRRQTLDYSVRR